MNGQLSELCRGYMYLCCQKFYWGQQRKISVITIICLKSNIVATDTKQHGFNKHFLYWTFESDCGYNNNCKQRYKRLFSWKLELLPTYILGNTIISKPKGIAILEMVSGLCRPQSPKNLNTTVIVTFVNVHRRLRLDVREDIAAHKGRWCFYSSLSLQEETQ